MSAVTRLVLKHKRAVVISWVLLTIAGMAAAGPASRALDPEFSVPGGEGWETNVAIEQRYQGTGGNSAPLLPVVTSPRGRRSTDLAFAPSWRPSIDGSHAPCRAREALPTPLPVTGLSCL